MTNTLYFLLQALVEFGESKKILPVAGITLSEALPPIQHAFDIPVGCDILVQQYIRSRMGRFYRFRDYCSYKQQSKASVAEKGIKTVMNCFAFIHH